MTLALRVDGLSRRFGSRVALADLKLQVQAGDLYGFLGPNGAGKTTAIRCMLGLIRRHGGTVEIFGERDPVRQRRHVGALVETPAFHTWMSAWGNLRQAADLLGLSGRAARTAIAEAFERVGLAGRERDPVKTYSLGMRQRLGVARALLGKPRLLVLDEPTNGLDPRGMREVRDLLRDLVRRDGMTVFVSSHLLSEVEQLSNRVGIIEKGRLVAEGAVRELMRRGSGELVDVGTSDPVALSRAIEATTGVSLYGEGEGGRVRLRLDGLDAAELNQVLVTRGVPVQALVPVHKSLEDLFLQLTTRDLT